MTRKAKALFAALAALGLASGDARAVTLDSDGVGQALIYPFYTVQGDVRTDSWNTYISVVNTRAEAKVMRVRVREGRNGREIHGFNLYLAPNDVWTAALVPHLADQLSPAKIISADASCTNPKVEINGPAFSNAAYSGANADGLGAGLDRTREGYIEIIEMATLTGTAAAAAAMTDFGVPKDCGLLRGEAVALAGQVAAPTGGLSGTLTLINVATGMDMGVNAIALANLTSAPFYRNYNDPYPGFGAAEVLPVSTVTSGARSYDLRWTNGVDAVSSALMSAELLNEYVLDPGTKSQTDWVISFPTRVFYPENTGPFVRETNHLLHEYRDREGGLRTESPGLNCSFIPAGMACPPVTLAAAGSAPVAHFGSHSSLLSSPNGMRVGEISDYNAGWMRLYVAEGAGGFGRLRSEVTSVSTDLATGAITTGRFEVRGLPWVGFMVRSFRNGTLTCGLRNGVPQVCQGNYGGVFPHRHVRRIEALAP